MKWKHIVPRNDLKAHNTMYGKAKVICDCNPRFDWGSKLVIHNAYDLREAVEEAEEILKSLDNPKIMRTNEPEKSENFCDCGNFGPCTKFCICTCHKAKGAMNGKR